MKKFVALVALIGCLAAAQPARAGLILSAQEAGVNGGVATVIASGADFTSASFTGTYGDFNLTLLGIASHDTATLSSLLTATVSIQNNSGTFKTLNLFATQTNFDLPLGTPLNVESGLSGTVNVGTLTGTGVFQAFLDGNNTPFGMSDFTNGPQNVAFTGSTFDTGSATGVFTRPNALYSISEQITANISGGGEGNFSSHINVTPVAAVPEPASLALAGLAIPFGLLWLRRRKTAPVVS